MSKICNTACKICPTADIYAMETGAAGTAETAPERTKDCRQK